MLQLDCEGAEVDIPREMTIHPPVVLVNTHGLYRVLTALVCSQLEERRDRIIERGVAVPRLRSYCEQQGLRVDVDVWDEGGGEE